MSPFSGALRLRSQSCYDAASEAALIEQCRRQDFDAFGKIVDAYQARVLGFVRRMLRSEEDALDVTQEVFIKAYQAMHRFDGRSSLRTWLFKIAYNLCIDRSRRLERMGPTVSLEPAAEGEDAIDLPDNRWSPEEIVMNEELFAVVERAVETMSEKLRSVLLLADKEDMAYEEIAQLTGVPVGTVKSRLFLARAHVQKCVAAYLGGDR